MFGQECDALGLTRFDRERVQPERLPAVIKPVQEPEVMAMQMEDGGKRGAIGQCQHHGAADFDAEGGRG